MLLSRETVEGLYITGKCTRIFFSCTMKWFMFLVKSFVELSRKLLANPELKGKYVLSDHFCHRIRLKIISGSSGPVVDGARTQLLVCAYHLHSPFMYKEARQWSL